MAVPLRRLRPLALLTAVSALAACAGPSPRGVRPHPLARPSPKAVAVIADDEAAPDLASDPPLAELLRLALGRSPAILAARERALAAGEGAAVEGWLPDPQVMIGWYETSVETRVGPQQWSVGVRQAIPFPTKLSTKAEIEESEARRMRVAYERVVRDVLVDVVQTAHELAYIDEAVRVTADVGALLERYTAAAAAGETSSLVSELFRAETQRAQLENDRVILAELRAAEEQHLRSLLALPPYTTIGSPAIGPTPQVGVPLPELIALAEQHSQELREAGLALETARLRSSLADQRRVPDLFVGATRLSTERLPTSLGLNPPDNGKDPLILQFGATLPIWFQKDAAAIRRARALERAAAMDRAETVQRTRDRLARAWFQVGNSERLHRLYAEVLLPRAATAARTAEDLLPSGKGSLGGVLETIAVFHNFRLAAARARADHGRSVAELERVIGRAFTTEPGEAPAAGEEER